MMIETLDTEAAVRAVLCVFLTLPVDDTAYIAEMMRSIEEYHFRSSFYLNILTLLR